MIIIRVRQDDLIMSKDPAEYRTAYEWLMIEKIYKGQEWFVKEGLDRGLVLIDDDENNYRYWAYISEYEITLKRDEASMRLYSFDVVPKYVRLLRDAKEICDVPRAIEGLYFEVYPKTVEVAGV